MKQRTKKKVIGNKEKKELEHFGYIRLNLRKVHSAAFNWAVGRKTKCQRAE